MRQPRFRFRIRTLLLLVAMVALALVGIRIYRDGPEAHWLLLKLRYGNVEARRSATLQVREREFLDFADTLFSAPSSSRASEARWRRRQRGADLWLPALVQAATDADAECRANAVRALHDLAALHGSESGKRLALLQILEATRDREDSVRSAALGSLAGLADRDTGAVLDTLKLALADPSVEVRQAATLELGILGVIVPETQHDVASILIPLLASREDSRVRVKAAWGLCYFGADHRRHPVDAGPDVVPALVATLQDPDLDVRRTAAVILGSTTFDAQGRISYWDQRKDSIIPALNAAISDEDAAVRDGSALALFALGQRDLVIIERIEQAARDPARSQKTRFASAWKEWQAEQVARASGELVDPGDGAS